MPTPLTAAVAQGYVVGRAYLNNGLLGWTDANGQGWAVSVVSVSAADSAMQTHLRLRFDPIILITLLPDLTRQAQEFDVSIGARDTATGSIAPGSWV
jgi:hypothetical protein